MNIAIAGYGIEGKASYEYWDGGEHELTIVDERTGVETPHGAKTILGEGAFRKLQDFDMVVRTASLPPSRIQTNGKIWSATNEFFAKCPAQIIGVTGTKGKGTTCSLITSILRAAGKTVHLVGNIGMPALEVLPQIRAEDIAVYELSSFQLWDLKKSPHVAVILPIEPDHLDVHASMEEYVNAKSTIARWQTADDFVIFHAGNDFSHQIAASSLAQKIEYPFAIDEFISSLQIPGAHNVENATAAIAVARIFDINNDMIKRGLANFCGLPHRLELIAEHNSVKWYDDSFSSATPATIVAVQAFEQPKILICGGYDRGLDYSDFAQQLSAVSNLKKVLAIGQTGPKIVEALHAAGHENAEFCSEKLMTQIVAKARGYAKPGDVVLLSPGCASFDMFKNFSDRGEQFQIAVRQL